MPALAAINEPQIDRARRRIRLGVLVTHPIQYHAPWFRAMAAHHSLDLKVLFCHQAAPGEQAAAGFDVAFDWDVPLLEGYAWEFLRNRARKPSVLTFSGLDTPEIAAQIQQNRFDAVIVIGWHYKSAWQAIRACWRKRIPVMVRGDSHLKTERSVSKRLAKAVPYRFFISRLDACLAVGKWSTEYFAHYGAKPERIFHVPHSVDPSFEDRSTQLIAHHQELRQRWGIKPGDTAFVFAGKFVAKKRPVDFLQAIERSRKRCSAIAGLMVGDGPLRGQCEQMVARLNLPVHFTGFLNQSEIAKAYVAADTLVLPSDGGETWGLVVNEAMSCGRPCLVSDRVGCGPDLVIPGQTGDVFPMGDVETLAELFATYAANQSRLHAMGARAKEQARRYSVSSAVDGVLAALQAVTKAVA